MSDGMNTQPHAGYDSEDAWAADDPHGYAFNCAERRRLSSDVATFDRLAPGTRVRSKTSPHKTGTILRARGWVEGEGWFYDVAFDGDRFGDCDRFLEPIPSQGD